MQSTILFDLLLKENNIKDLARSGCDNIWMGAESGAQKVLDAMDKGTQIEQIRQATALLRKHHIKPCFFLQFGYPGEFMPEIKETLALVGNLKPHDIGISVSYPLPGTKFYENVKADLVQKQNWTDSDDLHLMFGSSYSPRFYKYLQRYVHYRFRTNQAFELFANKTFNRRSLLMPYYILQQRLFRQKLINAEPDAGRYL